MNIQLRFYKRFDADLLSLYDAGIRVNTLIRDALDGLAHGTPRKFLVPQVVSHDLNDRQFIHTSINITDPETIKMLKAIKHGYRCSFCKMVLRDALVFQSLGVYFSDSRYLQEAQDRIDEYLTSTHEGVDVCKFRKKKKLRAEEVLGDNALKEDVRKSLEEAMNVDIDSVLSEEEMMENQVSLDIPDDPSEDRAYEENNEDDNATDLLNLFSTILTNEENENA